MPIDKHEPLYNAGKTSYTCYDKPGMKFPKAMTQIPQGRFVVESHAALSLLIIKRP